MQLYAVGLNHQTAPVSMRERVAFAPDAIKGALQTLLQRGPAKEAAIVSTCNRTELYCAGGAPDETLGWLADYHSVPRDALLPHTYSLVEDQSVRHAFRVASGLDSMVLGEPQILGQMKSAARVAEDAGVLGTTLHHLFQRTFAVAKEVRTTTGVGANVVSMAAAGVRLALRIFPTLADRSVLFIGAGEMIELCAAHFAGQHPKRMAVANRTLERASVLAARFGAEAIELRALPDQLAQFDVVVSCTASTLPIIGKGMVERALKQRRRTPIVIIDLAVPRDVEPEVERLDDIYLYTVDALASLVDSGVEARRSAATHAESLIDGQVGRFMHWLQARDAVPLIKTLRERGESMRSAEFDRAARALARGDDPLAVIEALSHAITNKMLHAPSQAISTASGADLPRMREALASLLGATERR